MKPFFVLYLVSFLLVFVGCGKDTLPQTIIQPEVPEETPEEVPEIPDTIVPVDTDTIVPPIIVDDKYLEVKDVNGQHFMPFLHANNTLYYILPHNTDFSSLIPVAPYEKDSLHIDGENISLDGRCVDFSDFTKLVEYRRKKDGDTLLSNNCNIVFFDLPVLIIDTPNSVPITSKEVRIEGCQMKLITEKGNTDIGTAGIRGRGSSTWNEPKKPYNIKLDEKAEILGMKKSKHWILLANAKYDHTQLHNSTAFEIARMTDYPWVQSGKYVELILNGEHKGLYYLCEKVRIESGRIDIKMSAQDDVTDCAYLMESLVAVGKNHAIRRTKHQFGTDILCSTGHDPVWCTFGWEIKEPEDDIVSEQTDYIQKSLQYVEALIRDSLSSGKYRDYFDIETAINWWMVQELCLNEESSRTKNVYLYKKGRKGRFCVGPPWDLDAWSFGTAGINMYWAKNYALYYKHLFKDPLFVNRVKDKWQEYKPKWAEKIPQFIDGQYRLIRRSAERNEKMWPDWIVPSSSYEQSVIEMRDAFLRQLNWMDGKIRSL